MSTFYQIKVKGHLNQAWSEWFDGLTLTNLERGEAMIHGMIVDQAALYGLISKVRDLHLTLISVSPLEAHSPSKEEAKEESP